MLYRIAYYIDYTEAMKCCSVAILPSVQNPGGRTSDHDGLIDPHQMVPRLVTRRGPVLTAFLRAAPLLISWPLIVTVLMAFISKRSDQHNVEIIIHIH